MTCINSSTMCERTRYRGWRLSNAAALYVYQLRFTYKASQVKYFLYVLNFSDSSMIITVSVMVDFLSLNMTVASMSMNVSVTRVRTTPRVSTSSDHSTVTVKVRITSVSNFQWDKVLPVYKKIRLIVLEFIWELTCSLTYSSRRYVSNPINYTP